MPTLSKNYMPVWPWGVLLVVVICICLGGIVLALLPSSDASNTDADTANDVAQADCAADHGSTTPKGYT